MGKLLYNNTLLVRSTLQFTQKLVRMYTCKNADLLYMYWYWVSTHTIHVLVLGKCTHCHNYCSTYFCKHMPKVDYKYFDNTHKLFFKVHTWLCCKNYKNIIMYFVKNADYKNLPKLLFADILCGTHMTKL